MGNQPRKRTREERVLAERRARLRRERGPLPEAERDRWHLIDGPGENWTTSVRFVIREGRPVIAQLRVTPFQAHQWSEPMDIPSGGLTTTDLRRIHIKWDDELHNTVAELFAETGYQAKVGRRVRPKYEQKDDDFFAEKAVEYLDALRKAPTRPLAYLEQKYRGQWITRGQLRDYVHQARERGFLTPGRQGRAGAEPTEKLRDWAKGRKIRLPEPRKKRRSKER